MTYTYDIDGKTGTLTANDDAQAMDAFSDMLDQCEWAEATLEDQNGFTVAAYDINETGSEQEDFHADLVCC